jgi:predicted MPP superfamily phosphohydrolase
MNRRKFLKRSLVAAPVAAAAGAGYGRYIERHDVEVVPVDLDLGLGRPLTAALLSDFHFDPLFEIDYLRTVVAATHRAAPDLVLYAGDFVSHSTDRLPELLDVLQRAEATFGQFAILGNHDHWVAADRVEDGLEGVGITVLRNRSVPLPGSPGWFLTGLESFWGGRPTTQPIEATPTHARHVLLVHEPDPFDTLTDPRIALQLSGHTHGGQVRLPFAGAIQLPSWGKKYDAGLYDRDGRWLYVNRGIGTVGKHYRVNCRPEITLLRLT